MIREHGQIRGGVYTAGAGGRENEKARRSRRGTGASGVRREGTRGASWVRSFLAALAHGKAGTADSTRIHPIPRAHERQKDACHIQAAARRDGSYKANAAAAAPRAHHASHSPYMFGRSPRMYASNVRLSTVDQSRSRLSSATWSSFAVSVALDAVAALSAVRARRSPSMKRGPKSGKLRAGSNGFHLRRRQRLIRMKAENARARDVPEIVEVVRVRAPVEAIESKSLWCRASLCRSLEELHKSGARLV